MYFFFNIFFVFIQIYYLTIIYHNIFRFFNYKLIFLMNYQFTNYNFE
jgi:hypothetical protein